MPDDKITQEDAASYLESDAYGKLPQAKKDEVIKFLKTNMVRGTPDVPSASQGVIERRQQTGGMTDERSALGHLATGVQTGVEGVVGLPGAVKRAATEPPTDYEKGRAKRHPVLFAEPQKGVGLTLDRLFFDPQFREASKAKESFKSGKVSEGLGHAGASVLPGAGPWAAGIGEQVGKGEWLDALGEQGVYALTGLMAKKAIPRGVKPWQRLSAAAGGGTKDFEATMGDLARTAKETGFKKIKQPMVSDLRQLVRKTGMDSESFFNQAVQPFSGDEIMPHDVARDLLKEADKFDRHTPEGRAARQYLRQRAIDYQKPWKFGELNQKRMKMFDSVLEGKTDVKQMGAVRSDVEKLADKTIENSLRDTVYDYAASKYKGKIDFRALKEKQARLLDLNDRLEKRVESIADQESEYRAAGPLKKAGLYIRGHMTGVTPAVHPKIGGSPEKAASKNIKKAFSRARNPFSAKPSPERRLPPLEPETPSSPQAPPKSSPSATAAPPSPMSKEASARDTDLFKQAKDKLGPKASLSEVAQEAQRMKEGKIPEGTRSGFQVGDLPDRFKPIKMQPRGEQGGHAGGGVSSVEELSRQGTNYVVTKGGKLTYHGKSFAPESTPSGATHVTVLPDGIFRVNAGETLTPAQENALKGALPKSAGKSVTVQGKPGTVIGNHPATKKVVIKMQDGSIVRVTPDEIKPGLSPLKATTAPSAGRPRILSQKEITENIGRRVQVADGTGNIVGFPMGKVKVRLENGHLVTVEWEDIKQ